MVSDFILVKMVYFWYHLCSMYILEVRFYRSGVPCRLTIIILLLLLLKIYAEVSRSPLFCKTSINSSISSPNLISVVFQVELIQVCVVDERSRTNERTSERAPCLSIFNCTHLTLSYINSRTIVMMMK